MANKVFTKFQKRRRKGTRGIESFVSFFDPVWFLTSEESVLCVNKWKVGLLYLEKQIGSDCERLVEHERKKGHLTLWHPAFRRCPFFNLPTFGLIMLHTIKGFLQKNIPKSMSPAKRIYLSKHTFRHNKSFKTKMFDHKECFPFKKTFILQPGTRGMINAFTCYSVASESTSLCLKIIWHLTCVYYQTVCVLIWFLSYTGGTSFDRNSER